MLKDLFEQVRKSKYILTALSLTTGFVYLAISLQGFCGLWDFCKEICGKHHWDFSEINWWLFVLVEFIFLLLFLIIPCGVNKFLFKNKKSFLELLANKPGKSSYDWRFNRSILNFLVFWMMWILRCISVLQFSKTIYRALKISHKKRADIPPFFQELYFIVWAIILIAQISCDLRCDFMYALDIYFVMESITWILYYTVFRRFFDKGYKIYHELEHLPTIFIIIPLQAIAYAACFMQTEETAWSKVIPVLMGKTNENMLVLSIFGFMYSAIVISLIISSFPKESIGSWNNITKVKHWINWNKKPYKK